MIAIIRSFFSEQLSLTAQREQARERSLEMAVAALLIEVSRADLNLVEAEKRSVEQTLKRQFSLTDEELDELVKMAELQVEESVSLYQFVQLVNENYEYADKVRLIEAMWEVAFADGELDKYEDHMIRKIAELIYVSHSDFIQRKLKVAEASDVI